MGDLSENFNRKEFECNCGCGTDTVDHELVIALERLRKEIGKPIVVTSGNRCPAYNRQVGGSPKSKHILSKAADIVVSSVEPKDIYSLLDSWYPSKYGIGLYDGWVHIDVRGGKARWDNRS